MKTVFISGGTRGIGRACAELYAKAGYNVCITYKESENIARELEKELGVFAVKADVSSSAEVKMAVSKAVERFGGIDVLVNNAGVSFVGLLQDTSDDTLRRVMDTNFSGAFYLCREVAPYMIASKSGAIVNIGSVWGKYGASCEAAYSASKSAIRGLTTALAKELGPSGVRVNCIEPGVIKTDMNACFDSETLDQLAEETALCRLGEPSEVAEAVFFLTSDKASFITGQCIGVDGGFPI